MSDPMLMTDRFPGFKSRHMTVGANTVFVRVGGSGPPLLLLHGFPETHLMWRDVAPLLAADFTVLCVDLRGYGGSGCPPSGPNHLAYSKRAMAYELVAMMGIFGYEKFIVAGHDRGGRVAYRMALDHPNTVSSLVVLDVVPIEAAWQFADDRLVMSYWPWSLLAQPEPLPERLLGGAPDAVIRNAAAQWGSLPTMFPEDVVDAYTAMLGSPAHVHAICEEYRAAAGIDRDHDLHDLETGQSILCPTLVVWSRDGPLDKWYDREGGAVGMWQPWARNVEGRAISGGHFFPEEYPVETAGILSDFFKRITS